MFLLVFVCLFVLVFADKFGFPTGGWSVAFSCTAYITASWLLSFRQKRVISPDGKAVLITGCDSGFGLELAKRLSSKGFYVYACCLSLESDGARELLDSRQPIRVLQLDVTKSEQVQSTVKEVEVDLGDKKLWCVVNNAGVFICSELEWCSVSTMEKMIDVNVLGVLRVTKDFLPLLRSARGRVVIVCSLSSHVTFPGYTLYGMSKHAVLALSDGLRREMRKWGVFVSRIEPALYKTGLIQLDVLNASLDNIWQKTPDHIKEDYGMAYYEGFKRKMFSMNAQARTNLFEVVDSMERAVTEVQPRNVYQCQGYDSTIFLCLIYLLPDYLGDWLICKNSHLSNRLLPGGGQSKNSPAPLST